MIDTYRLGGILSRRHDDQTYRTFSSRRGPDRTAAANRCGRPACTAIATGPAWCFTSDPLASAQRPVSRRHETSAFGGSDYISDPDTNAAHQQTALSSKTMPLWSQSYRPYTQMRAVAPQRL